MKKIITIDGPVASGKSTVARLLARELGFNYLTSGFFYRVIAYGILRDCPALDETCMVSDEQLDRYVRTNSVKYAWDTEGLSHIYLNGEDVTPFLKTYRIDQCSSQLAMHPIMRDYTMHMQRTLASHHNIVAEGRDIGSVIFPQACVKFFLTADSKVRAKRWQDLQHKLGTMLSFAQARAKIAERDKRDEERELAPLIVPDNAIVIDGSALTAEQVVQAMLKYIPKNMAE